jgi:hypothetical protein
VALGEGSGVGEPPERELPGGDGGATEDARESGGGVAGLESRASLNNVEGESKGESEDNRGREGRGVDGGDTLGVRDMISSR